jgi:hypothetical protein
MEKTMTDMTEEIHLIIKKTLPAHVGEVLAKELEQLKLLREQRETDQRVIKLRESRITELESKNKDLLTQIECHAKLDERLNKVIEREQKMDLVDLKAQLAELRRQDAVELVKLVFKSPTFRTVQTGTTPISIPATPPSPNNSYGVPATVVSMPMASDTQTGEAP